MVAAARKNNPGGRRQTTQARSTRGNGVAAGTVNYPGAAAHTGSGRSGFRAVEHSDFLGSTPVALNIYYNSNWQAVETRTNGTAASNVTSQMVWSAAYINAAILQDTYTTGVIQPNSRLYYLQDANWDTTAVVGFNSTTGTWGVTQRYVYSPYGNITVLNADWSTPPAGTQPVVDNLYQGMTLDPVTGLYYERNRNYNPTLGIWISQDPLSYVSGANTYQFVGSGPVDAADAGGLRLSFTDAQNLIPPPWQVTAVTRVTYTQDFHGPGTTTEDGLIFRTYTTIKHGTRTTTYHVHAEKIKNGVLCTRSFTIVRTRKMTVKIVTNNKDSIDFFANGLQWEGTGVGVIGSAITFVDPITGIIGVGAGGLMIIGGGVLGWMSGNDEVPPSVNVSPGTVVSTSLLP